MKLIKIIPIVGLTLLLTACGSTMLGDSVEQGSESQVVSGSGESSKNEQSKSIVIKEEAAFVGQVDSNSIEVNTETETLTLRIGEGINVDWSSLDQNTHVTIEYIINEMGQHELTGIEVAEIANKKVAVQKVEAAYVGQIDGNSIEVNTESKTMALQVGEITDVDWSLIEKGTPIVMEYYTNESGQNILTSITVNR